MMNAQIETLGKAFGEAIKGQEPLVVVAICCVFIVLMLVVNGSKGSKSLGAMGEGSIKLASETLTDLRTVRTELSESNDAVLTLSEQLNGIRLKLRDLESEAIAARHRADKAEERAIAADARALELQKAQEAAAEVHRLALDEANKKLDAIQKQLDDSEKEREALQTERDTLQTEREELRNEVKELRSIVEDLRGQLGKFTQGESQT